MVPPWPVLVMASRLFDLYAAIRCLNVLPSPTLVVTITMIAMCLRVTCVLKRACFELKVTLSIVSPMSGHMPEIFQHSVWPLTSRVLPVSAHFTTSILGVTLLDTPSLYIHSITTEWYRIFIGSLQPVSGTQQPVTRDFSRSASSLHPSNPSSSPLCLSFHPHRAPFLSTLYASTPKGRHP